MISLNVITPEEIVSWNPARRSESLLLVPADMEIAPPVGWLEIARLEKGSLPASPVFSASRFVSDDRAGEDARHGAACVCCNGRSALVTRLLLIYQERARGSRAFFRHIALVVSRDQRTVVLEALRADEIVCSLFTPETEE
ncbi:hypothetical protein [Acetobacter sp.]|uniref:hypothetical protein n=1 Tax=Acetobacter sp. TaxID=440 RepID=UPI0039ED6694